LHKAVMLLLILCWAVEVVDKPVQLRRCCATASCCLLVLHVGEL